MNKEIYINSCITNKFNKEFSYLISDIYLPNPFIWGEYNHKKKRVIRKRTLIIVPFQPTLDGIKMECEYINEDDIGEVLMHPLKKYHPVLNIYKGDPSLKYLYNKHPQTIELCITNILRHLNKRIITPIKHYKALEDLYNKSGVGLEKHGEKYLIKNKKKFKKWVDRNLSKILMTEKEFYYHDTEIISNF
jgi:hypothetical protein